MIRRILRLPPVLFLLSVTAASIMQARVPLTLGVPSFAVGMTAGALLLVLAVTVSAGAFVQMKRHRTTIEPGKRPTSLVVEGVFGISRNPLYLSQILVVVALSLMMNGVWFLVAAAILGFVLDRVVIRWEERVLTEIFADRYIAYQRRVRRWL